MVGELPNRSGCGWFGKKTLIEFYSAPVTAGGGTRTHTLLPERDFESRASANSATPAELIHQRLSIIGYFLSMPKFPKQPHRALLPLVGKNLCIALKLYFKQTQSNNLVSLIREAKPTKS